MCNFLLHPAKTTRLSNTRKTPSSKSPARTSPIRSTTNLSKFPPLFVRFSVALLAFTDHYPLVYTFSPMKHALLLLPLSAAALAQAPQKGIEVSDLNRSVDPCTDFFEYSNGTWRADNPMPASMVRWSRRWQAGETAKEQLKTILDDVSAKKDWPKGSVEQLISDHYGSCMDEARANKLGATPIKP